MNKFRGRLDHRHQQPALSGFDFMNGLFGKTRLRPLRFSGAGLVKQEAELADLNLIAVTEQDRLRDATAIQVSPVAAAEVNEPEFVLTLGVDQRVAPRNLVVRQ